MFRARSHAVKNWNTEGPCPSNTGTDSIVSFNLIGWKLPSVGIVSRWIIGTDVGVSISSFALSERKSSCNSWSFVFMSVITRKFAFHALSFSDNVKSMSLSNVPNTISIFSIYILSITVRTLILRGAYPTAATKHFLTVMCSIWCFQLCLPSNLIEKGW